LQCLKNFSVKESKSWQVILISNTFISKHLFTIRYNPPLFLFHPQNVVYLEHNLEIRDGYKYDSFFFAKNSTVSKSLELILSQTSNEIEEKIAIPTEK